VLSLSLRNRSRRGYDGINAQNGVDYSARKDSSSAKERWTLASSATQGASMNKAGIKSAGDALDYLADCTLATVCDLAEKKSRSDSEFRRQITIAQVAIDCMCAFGVLATGRAETVISEYSGVVRGWVEQYDVKLKKEQA
jgi:hypothetical protein